MTTILTGVARRPLSLDSFADLTDAPLSVRWDGPRATLEFDDDLDPVTQDAIRARLESRNDHDQALRECLARALEVNRTYLANPAPTATELEDHVGSLTEQVIDLIELALEITPPPAPEPAAEPSPQPSPDPAPTTP